MSSEQEEKKVNIQDRITVSFSKEGAERIAKFFSNTGIETNRSKFIESVLLKEIELHEEKQRAKNRIRRFALEKRGIFSFGLNNQGFIDAGECRYYEKDKEGAFHLKAISFDDVAGGLFFSRTERIEILNELLNTDAMELTQTVVGDDPFIAIDPFHLFIPLDVGNEEDK